MRVKELRKERSGGRLTTLDARRLREAKRWWHKRWDEADTQDLSNAIKDAVNAEAIMRDNREFGIPISGSVMQEVSQEESRDADERQPIRKTITIDRRLFGLRHGYQECRHEHRRRLHLVQLRRPEPTIFADLLGAIVDDDGKDEHGDWLCTRDNWDDRLPKWFAMIPNGADSVEGDWRGIPDGDLPRRRPGRPPGSRNKIHAATPDP